MRTPVAILTLASCLVVACCGETQPSAMTKVAIWAQDGPPGGGDCPGATSIEGVLTLGPEPMDLFVAETSTASPRPVIWPPGFSATRDLGGLTLLDETDHPVAKVGDLVRVPVEVGGDPGAWYACGHPTVVRSW
jgi:hypothetical protein